MKPEAESAERAPHTARPRSAFGGTVATPLTAATIPGCAGDKNHTLTPKAGEGGASNRGRRPRPPARSHQTPALPPPRVAHTSSSQLWAAKNKKSGFA